ncbi:hypothetical protein KC19_VG294300 [Ceratodon purpureus]|uniref:Uncharacterized protein n=1 Tax=Ceratodon purpureus TaxID=3225 RepID=A0A8T0HWN4_CERPU|nr:hypothetical protein KC19_VG294300 [Ceratodon purpureus]
MLHIGRITREGILDISQPARKGKAISKHTPVVQVVVMPQHFHCRSWLIAVEMEPMMVVVKEEMACASSLHHSTHS